LQLYSSGFFFFFSEKIKEGERDFFGVDLPKKRETGCLDSCLFMRTNALV
jgi:hypothetical protein